jgi:hypothetical protein
VTPAEFEALLRDGTITDTLDDRRVGARAARRGVPAMSLDALSPLDGRYAGQVAELRRHLSEEALIRRRIEVELAWLRALRPDLDVPDVVADSGRGGRGQGDRAAHEPRRQGRSSSSCASASRPRRASGSTSR